MVNFRLTGTIRLNIYQNAELTAEQLHLELSGLVALCSLLGIKQSRDHVQTKACNNLLAMYHSVRRSTSVNMPTDELANRFVIYESMIKTSLRRGAPRTKYLNQISSHILLSGEKSLKAEEIRKMAVKKSEWSQLFVLSKKKKPPDRSDDDKLVR